MSVWLSGCHILHRHKEFQEATAKAAIPYDSNKCTGGQVLIQSPTVTPNYYVHLKRGVGMVFWSASSVTSRNNKEMGRTKGNILKSLIERH